MENIFLKNLEKENNYTETQNGALTHKSTLDANLDLFAKTLRYLDETEINNLVIKAIGEDIDLAFANILYLLDIRGGKGERRAFKVTLDAVIDYIRMLRNQDGETMSEHQKDVRVKLYTVMANIGELGRYDYLIDIIGNDKVYGTDKTHGDKYIIEEWAKLVNTAIKTDTLVFKWLPTQRSKKAKRRQIAWRIRNTLDFYGGNVMSKKEYDKMLTTGRKELRLIETLLTEKRYDEINLSKVPAKALGKYSKAFEKHMEEKLKDFNNKVISGEVKINTTALFPYEIMRKLKLAANSIALGVASNLSDEQSKLLNNQWNNLQDFVGEDNSAIVVADTSGSMEGTPLETSIGLALYFAERNKGVWGDKFITFSRNANFVQVNSELSLEQRIRGIRSIIQDTNIDSVFNLILSAASQSEEAAKDMPEHIILVSDMEFNKMAESETGTNFEGWKRRFEEKGLKLPKIIFWNASQHGQQSMPVTKEENDVTMVSGFSTAIFENLFNLEEFTLLNNMRKTLEKYIQILNK